MADHQRFSLATDIDVCLCDPQHPWQRVSNENTNGPLRQYFPQGMDLANIHINSLTAVARQLDEGPRETLHFFSPAEKFSDERVCVLMSCFLMLDSDDDYCILAVDNRRLSACLF